MSSDRTRCTLSQTLTRSDSVARALLWRSGSYDHTIRVWDATTAAASRAIYGSKRVISCLDYSELSQRIGTPHAAVSASDAATRARSVIATRTDIEVEARSGICESTHSTHMV